MTITTVAYTVLSQNAFYVVYVVNVADDTVAYL